MSVIGPRPLLVEYLPYYTIEKINPNCVNTIRIVTLRAGPYFVLRKIIAEYRLDEMLGDIIGKNSGLFLDLAVN